MNNPVIPGVGGIIGPALLAQRERMSLIASNMANADSISKPGTAPFRAEEPVFSAEPALANSPIDTVAVQKITQDQTPVKLVYDPGSTFANAQGYVQGTNVDPAQQMTDLISASQGYAADIAVLDQSAKSSQAMLQSFIA
jgi:flagellar basal-body rod protein FlgC